MRQRLQKANNTNNATQATADATHDNVTADNKIETTVQPTTRSRQRAPPQHGAENVQQTTYNR
jgi:hypothetical protein